MTQTVGCNVKTITSDGVSSSSCEVWYGDSSFARSVTVRRDATPPQVTGSSFERGADAEGWYNKPVAVGFSGCDATSGIASCDRPTFSGPDGSSSQVSGSCRDVAGNTSPPSSVSLKFDATPPAAAASPDRAPDGKGWYRRPVTVKFTGSDGASGLASCTPAARYAGPDRQDVAVAGSCRDVAGNVSAEQRLTFGYDATAPKLRAVKARVTRGVARVGWQKPADAVLVQDRACARRERREADARLQRDRRDVRRPDGARGVTYRYEVSALDAAGNVDRAPSSPPVRRPALYQPPAQASVRAPFVLAWRAAPSARYYNVQLHRNGVKVLTAWPRKPQFRIKRSWRSGGQAADAPPGRLHVVRLAGPRLARAAALREAARLEPVRRQALAPPRTGL